MLINLTDIWGPNPFPKCAFLSRKKKKMPTGLKGCWGKSMGFGNNLKKN